MEDGGSVGQWSQIRITLMRSRIHTEVKKLDPDPHYSEKLDPDPQ
jgi:hypothetical protein